MHSFEQNLQTFESEHVLRRQIDRSLVDDSLFTRDSSIRLNSHSFASSNITEEISRSDLTMSRNQNQKNQSQASHQFEFSNQQRQELLKIIVEVLQNQTRDEVDLTSLDDILFVDSNIEDQTQSNERDSQNWKLDKVEFFDLEYKDSSNVNSFIVNFERHVFYRDVYVFIDRVKNLTLMRDFDKFRMIISQCFRDNALIWHFMKLSKMKKKLLREASLQAWSHALINRFKTRTLVALQRLQKKRYIIRNARIERNSRLYAQKMFRHAKIVEIESIYQ